MATDTSDQRLRPSGFPADDIAVEDVTALPPDAAGTWLVATQTSTYTLDLTAGTITRTPSVAAGGQGERGDSDYYPAQLRRDEEPIPVLAVSCHVGRPMQLLLALRGDGVQTLRLTTPVLSIAPYGMAV